MMNTIDMTIWQGREDPEEGDLGLRWHQVIQSADHSQKPGIMLLGFLSDVGVGRNKGRTGAYDGPIAARKALTNLCWHQQLPLYDGGNIRCDNGNLEQAQQQFGETVTQALRQQHKVIAFGGGHEIAWASFQGLANYVIQKQPNQPNSPAFPRIGIINFDAHLDLRLPPSLNQGSSGTPFMQAANFCRSQGLAFNYACFGVNRASNSQALYQRAQKLNVLIREDNELTERNLDGNLDTLEQFVNRCDYLYLTIDIDVFPASVAPGVSAPASRGISVEMLEQLLEPIFNATTSNGSSKLLITDFAELNPRFDIDDHTARLVAKLAWLVSYNIR